MTKLGRAVVVGAATLLLLLPVGAAGAQTYPCHVEADLPDGSKLCVRDLEWHLGIFCWNMEERTGLEAQTGVDWCPWERVG